MKNGISNNKISQIIIDVKWEETEEFVNCRLQFKYILCTFSLHIYMSHLIHFWMLSTKLLLHWMNIGKKKSFLIWNICLGYVQYRMAWLQNTMYLSLSFSRFFSRFFVAITIWMRSVVKQCLKWNINKYCVIHINCKYLKILIMVRCYGVRQKKQPYFIYS